MARCHFWTSYLPSFCRSDRRTGTTANRLLYDESLSLYVQCHQPCFIRVDSQFSSPHLHFAHLSENNHQLFHLSLRILIGAAATHLFLMRWRARGLISRLNKEGPRTHTHTHTHRLSWSRSILGNKGALKVICLSFSPSQTSHSDYRYLTEKVRWLNYALRTLNLHNSRKTYIIDPNPIVILGQDN